MRLKNKTILVTGGTGSLGKVLVGRLLSLPKGNLPKKIIVMSRDEGKQHDMRLSYLDKKASTDEVIYKNFQQALEFRIGDVRSFADVTSSMKGADIVINAAAMKQVPTSEYFPEQAILTNCIGATNIVRSIAENDFNIDTVLGISTDKAAKPINVMGMTKALQERVLLSANVLNPKTRFICVRYGNVLASRGSVIPLFHHQISQGGPLTVTVSDMTRFLLTLNQAVDTVFAALSEAEPGDIFVPNAPSVTISNLAKAMVRGTKVKIKETGIRPAEKIHEIMISDEESNYTVKKGNFFAIKSMLPEINKNKRIKSALMGEFSSGNNVLDLDGTYKLLKKNNLLPGMVTPEVDGEFLA